MNTFLLLKYVIFSEDDFYACWLNPFGISFSAYLTIPFQLHKFCGIKYYVNLNNEVETV
jgi:hypothetical protein